MKVIDSAKKLKYIAMNIKDNFNIFIYRNELAG
jgi:hypothetical protein